MDPKKGEKDGECNRSCCLNVEAEYFNHSTLKYYCDYCADILNDANKIEAIELFGHELCTKQ